MADAPRHGVKDMIIGVTGKRHHGKTETSLILQRLYGYQTGHAFAAGKAMAKAYFVYCGASEEEAEAMINGHLKDEPSPYLPGIGPFSVSQSHGTPRFFMETLGHLMPTYMGVAWTAGVVIERLLSGLGLYDLRFEKKPRIVFESVVYEDNLMRSYKIPIIKIYNPNPPKEVEGLMTDSYVEQITFDHLIVNDGTKQDLERSVIEVMDKLGIPRVG